MSAKWLAARIRASTRLTLSNISVQSMSEISLMLVTILRMVTFDAPCLCWECWTTSSIDDPCWASFSSSHASAGVVEGSLFRNCLARCAAKRSGRGAADRAAMFALKAASSAPGSRSLALSADASARAASPAVIWSASRRRFSTRTNRNVIATAHNSPMVSG